MSPLMESLASFKGSGSETAISKEASAPAGTVGKPQVQLKECVEVFFLGGWSFLNWLLFGFSIGCLSVEASRCFLKKRSRRTVNFCRK